MMMMMGKRLLVAALVVALAQIGFLSWIIAGRAAVLRSGREIVLKVQPIDPNDLLRGDYVQLTYEISRIPTTQITNIPPGQPVSKDGWMYVRVKKGGDGYWHPASATFDGPLGATPEPDEADVRGHIAEGWGLAHDDSIGVDYGIDRFYLPEGEGLALQQDMRVRPFGVRIALASDGTPAIKTLLDGDKPLYEEPLY
jgi:uncharacterized membrane-anchored protein